MQTPFVDFVRGTNMNLFNGSSPKSIVIMDYCSIHYVQEVINLFQTTGILVMFFLPYSPDYNPVEEAFNYVKCNLKRHKSLLQTIPDKTPVIKSALHTITTDLACSWINDCSYS